MSHLEVLIPFHRNDEFLRDAIKSVLENLPSDSRIIAINDSNETIERDEIGLRPEDLLLVSKSKGYVGALGTGVNASSAEFVSFLDSDDLCGKNRFDLQIAALKQADADYCSGKLIRITSEGVQKSQKSILGDIPDEFNSRQAFLLGSHRADSTVVIKGSLIRQAWKIHGTFPGMFADYGFALSLPRNTRFTHEPKAIYKYRAHSGQMSRSPNIESFWLNLHQYWISNYNMVRGEQEECSMEEVSPRVTLAIAFPSSMVRLSQRERIQAIALLEEIRKILSKTTSETEKAKIDLIINRRCFLISRFTTLSYSKVMPGLFKDILFNYLSGIRPRYNNADN